MGGGDIIYKYKSQVKGYINVVYITTYITLTSPTSPTTLFVTQPLFPITPIPLSSLTKESSLFFVTSALLPSYPITLLPKYIIVHFIFYLPLAKVKLNLHKQRVYKNSLFTPTPR